MGRFYEWLKSCFGQLHPAVVFSNPLSRKGLKRRNQKLEMLLKLSKLRNQVERMKRVRNKRHQGHKKIRKLQENHMEIWFFNGTDSTKKQWQKWIQSNFGVVSPWKFLLSSNPWSEISRWKRTSHKVSLARSSMNPYWSCDLKQSTGTSVSLSPQQP